MLIPPDRQMKSVIAKTQMLPQGCEVTHPETTHGTHQRRPKSLDMLQTHTSLNILFSHPHGLTYIHAAIPPYGYIIRTCFV